MAIRPTDVLVPRYDDLTEVKCISEFVDNAVYKDNKRDGTNGVKADFMVITGPFRGFVFTVKFKKLPTVELMEDYYITFDKEETRPYVQNNNAGISFWGTDLVPIEQKKS